MRNQLSTVYQGFFPLLLTLFLLPSHGIFLSAQNWNVTCKVTGGGNASVSKKKILSVDSSRLSILSLSSVLISCMLYQSTPRRGQERPFMTVMLRDSYNDQVNT